jgi:hypothetical protein
MNLVGLSRWGLVPVRMLTVGADAVAKLHTQGAVSERSRVGAAERARPLGVGVDVFGELEFFVGDARRHHEVHPHAVTHELMRHGRLRLYDCNRAPINCSFRYLANRCATTCRGGAERAFVK